MNISSILPINTAFSKGEVGKTVPDMPGGTLPIEAEHLACQDYEYERNGTANLADQDLKAKKKYSIATGAVTVLSLVAVGIYKVVKFVVTKKI